MDFKRPESVLIIVYTQTGEVLLLNRQQPEGFWQSVTGSLEWGELACEAALRELQEETGLETRSQIKIDSAESPGNFDKAERLSVLIEHPEKNCFPIATAWRSKYDPEIDHNIEHLFSLCLPNVQQISLSAEEHSEYQWLATEEAIAKATSYTNKKAINDIVRPISKWGAANPG